MYRGNCTRQSPQPKFKAKELKVYFVIIHCCAYDIHCVAVSTEKRDKQIISLAQWLPFTSCHFIWLLLFLLSVVFQFWCGYLLLLQLRFDWRYFLLDTHTHFCIETTISVFKFNQSLWWGVFSLLFLAHLAKTEEFNHHSTEEKQYRLKAHTDANHIRFCLFLPFLACWRFCWAVVLCQAKKKIISNLCL